MAEPNDAPPVEAGVTPTPYMLVRLDETIDESDGYTRVFVPKGTTGRVVDRDRSDDKLSVLWEAAYFTSELTEAEQEAEGMSPAPGLVLDAEGSVDPALVSYAGVTEVPARDPGADYQLVKLPLTLKAMVQGGILHETDVLDADGVEVDHELDLDDRDIDDEDDGPTLDLSAEWRENDGKHAQNLGD